ncbi:MAG: hypothetical protein HC799_09115 [Limnothrix sp. RL_2_0]|nr:hypothetical protein [Limnothrix sp. RL_2_0]
MCTDLSCWKQGRGGEVVKGLLITRVVVLVAGFVTDCPTVDDWEGSGGGVWAIAA